MIDFNQCDSKRCTGRKLLKFKLLQSINNPKKKYRGIVLSANGKSVISMEDMEIAKKHGLCVIDCSWNRIEETHKNIAFENERYRLSNVGCCRTLLLPTLSTMEKPTSYHVLKPWQPA